ncbi:MAG: energy coupling factor transporter S component ThiW [Clostridia bacterium]|nr:energy coupling factor transporter S component ThiW [Clostridia bacterium]
MNSITARKLAVSGVLIAVGVVCSPLCFPVGAAKCFPIQHLINIMAAVFLGPLYAVIMAFLTSVLRLAAGMGTMLAFPGSMFGALIGGLCYKLTKKLPFTYIGELIGTGIIGALAAYPIAVFAMGKECAVFAYIIPFIISSAGGTIIAVFLVTAIKKTHALDKFFEVK